jgi:hypothetical protein
MQQAARTSDYTAFLYLGELIEFDETETISTHPAQRQAEDYITGRFGLKVHWLLKMHWLRTRETRGWLPSTSSKAMTRNSTV